MDRTTAYLLTIAGGLIAGYAVSTLGSRRLTAARSIRNPGMRYRTIPASLTSAEDIEPSEMNHQERWDRFKHS